MGRSGKQGEIYWTKISPAASNHVMVHPSQSVPHVTVKQTSHIKLPNKVWLLEFILFVYFKLVKLFLINIFEFYRKS